MFRSTILATALCAGLLACHSSDSADPTQLATGSTGLVFTGINSGSYPWQTNVYRLDTETFDVEQLLSGESGDPAVFLAGSDIFLFNRSSESQNFRLITPQEDTLLLGNQTKFAGGEIGDPHDALDLGNDALLLAHYTEGRLTIMKKSTGERVADVDAAWDLPAGVALKPEALWKAKVDGRTFIYVIHQAYGFESGLFVANGSQKIFVLEQTDAGVTPLDMDPTSPGIQGIKLAGSFPIVVRRESEDKLLVVSMCSRYVSPSPSDPSNVCHNAVEELDPKTQSVALLWDMDGTGFGMNGSVAPAGGDNTFFAQVERLVDGVYARQLVKFNPGLKSDETIYTYGEGSGGYYGMYFDEARGNLFIGDINTDTFGKFTIIKADGTQIVKPLNGIPYSGAFVY